MIQSLKIKNTHKKQEYTRLYYGLFGTRTDTDFLGHGLKTEDVGGRKGEYRIPNKEYRMMKCGGRRSGNQLKEQNAEDRRRKAEDRRWTMGIRRSRESGSRGSGKLGIRGFN